MIERACELLADRHLFITGGAGTGKSHLTRELIALLSRGGKRIAALGSTGVAAVNVGGQTVHSFFHLGLSQNLGELAMMDRKNRRLRDLLSTIANLDLIVIDEVSMISAALMEMIGFRLRAAGFSGRVIFVGDFYQLPPVVSRERGQGDLFSARWAFESDFWRELDPAVLELTTPWRNDDPAFMALLARLRRGRIAPEDEALLARFATQRSVLETDPTHLHGRNREVDSLNYQRLQALNAPAQILEAALEVKPGTNPARIERFVKNLPVAGRFELKEQTPVLFCANKRGSYVNGDRGTVLEFSDEGVLVQKASGEILWVEPHEFILSEHTPDEEVQLATFKQVPLRPAWAVTIHKSQGMGLSPLAINLDHIFEAGQLYVALSRSSDPAALFIQSRGDLIAKIKRSLHPNDAVDRFYGL
jgi:ATP-dependent exoDNAse (exonuclease V) alpha subunit